ncbi:hypothetical protein ACHAXS_010669, partial [Conticribra weissflogii]
MPLILMLLPLILPSRFMPFRLLHDPVDHTAVAAAAAAAVAVNNASNHPEEHPHFPSTTSRKMHNSYYLHRNHYFSNHSKKT